MGKITSIRSVQILDSRGNPTVEATVELDTTLVAGDVGESMYWYHYVKTVSPKPP